MLWSSSCLILYPFFRIDPVTPPSGEYGWSLMLCLNWVCFPWAGIPTDHVFWGARKISRYWRRESKRIEYGSHWSPQTVYTGVLFKALDGRWQQQHHCSWKNYVLTLYIVNFGAGHVTKEQLVSGGSSTLLLLLIVCNFFSLDVVYNQYLPMSLIGCNLMKLRLAATYGSAVSGARLISGRRTKSKRPWRKTRENIPRRRKMGRRWRRERGEKR